MLEAITFPEPVIRVAIEPKTKQDQDKMGIGLGKLSDEDPTFRVYTDQETGQTIIAGMGELHLEVIVDRLMREHRVDANVGRPQVAYRETITQPARARDPYKRQTGGRGMYGDVELVHRAARAGQRLPVRMEDRRRYRAARVLGRGRIGRARGARGRRRRQLPDGRRQGQRHRRLLPRGGLERDGVQDRLVPDDQGGPAQGQPTLLEPLMDVEVTTPDEFLGDVMGDLNSRRGQVEGLDPRGNAQVVRAKVPLAEMFGYATDLRSMTQGRATYSMQFSHYQAVPKDIGTGIAAKAGVR